jgi:hypothetical protein
MNEYNRLIDTLNSAIYKAGLKGSNKIEIDYESARGLYNMASDMLHSIGELSRTVEELEDEIAELEGERR